MSAQVTAGATASLPDFLVRARLPGASADPEAARTLIGLPARSDPPPRGDQHFSVSVVTVVGDDVIVEFWSAERATRDPDFRARRAACTALEDELLLQHGPEEGWYSPDEELLDGASVGVLNFVCGNCARDKDAILGSWRAEKPTSARRRLLRELGFRKLVIRCVTVAATYDL